MPKITQKQAIIAFMDNSDLVMLDTKARSTKYVTYNSLANPDKNYYVGNKGALRFGKNVKDSIPMLENRRQAIIKQGKKLLSS